MLFTDPAFLLRFLPTVLAAFFLAVAATPHRWKQDGRRFTLPNAVLLVGSVVFLAAGTGVFMRWIAGAVAFNYLVALAIGRARLAAASSQRPGPLPEALLTLGVTGNVVLLGVAKYALPLPDLFASRVFAVPQLLAPLGLTFFVCHALSYLVDVARGDAPAQINPIPASLYLLCFPLLCAGPLARYSDVSPQLIQRRATLAAFAFGVRRWLVGYCKVVFLAAALAGPVDSVFATSAAELTMARAWLGAVCFALQIYFDLSGYADMAIGFGRMFGFRFVENFGAPYLAGSLTDFWQRWNVTLLNWCRRYLYLPLTSTGASVWVRARQVALLFLCVGLWHGPGWTVLVWGGVHAAVVVLEQVWLAERLVRLPAVIRHAYVLLVVVLSWVVFRADSMAGAAVVLVAMSGLGSPVEVLGVAPIALTPWFWTMLSMGVLSISPLWQGGGRWLVTVDALTTSVLILISTSFVYLWRRLVNTARFLTGRQRTH
ncbi:MAG: MBOAT family protein [Acidobacteria bacterium]|nr:MBOAT family protein [Acidobacteriota bacterium]